MSTSSLVQLRVEVFLCNCQLSHHKVSSPRGSLLPCHTGRTAVALGPQSLFHSLLVVSDWLVMPHGWPVMLHG